MKNQLLTIERRIDLKNSPRYLKKNTFKFVRREVTTIFSTRILAPAGDFLALLERMFALLTFPTVIIIRRKIFVLPVY